MTDIKDMSVDAILEDFNRFVSVHEPEYSHMKEMARRLRELDIECNVHALATRAQKERAEQAEFTLLACQAECETLKLFVEAYKGAKKYAETYRHLPDALDDITLAWQEVDELAQALSHSTGSKIMAVVEAAKKVHHLPNPEEEPTNEQLDQCNRAMHELDEAVRALEAKHD